MYELQAHVVSDVMSAVTSMKSLRQATLPPPSSPSPSLCFVSSSSYL
jgi:hypothetical protein